MAGKRRIPLLRRTSPGPTVRSRALCVNTTEAVLFRRGGKIFAAIGPAVRGADNELAISKGVQTFVRPFPFLRPHAKGRW